MSRNHPLILALWAASVAVVGWASLTPGLESAPVLGRALLHLAAYAWLGMLPMLGLGARRAAITGAGTMIFLGAGLEVARAFVPQLAPSFLGLAADILGVALGMRLGVRLKIRAHLRQSGMDRHYHGDGSRKAPPRS
ncbi:VanZ family protein [Desulfocurvus sp. DL9XJH121]